MQNKVELISITPDYMKVLKTAASQCYQKEATNKVIDHIIEAGHLSVLEHCYATFKLSCSIQMLLQLTRHRHLSFTVQSSRGSELKECYKTYNAYIDECAEKSMIRSANLHRNEGIDRETAAYALPKAVMYNLVVTGNFRAWYEYLEKRLCYRAQKEHRQVAEEIHKLLIDNAPLVFGRNIRYYQCKNCDNLSCHFSKEELK